MQLASGEMGDVEAIGMRATRIRTGDETLLVVPNSVLVKERLVNLTQPTRSVTTKADVSVGYGADLGVVKSLLVDAARSSALIDADRAPSVPLPPRPRRPSGVVRPAPRAGPRGRALHR